MLKRIPIILTILLGSFCVTRAQTAHLRITTLINFPDTAFEGSFYPVGVVLSNIGIAPFSGPLQILIQADTLAPTLLGFTNNPAFSLFPGDSAIIFSNVLGSQGFTFTSQFFRPGNDIVEVWPYAIQSNAQMDTLYTAMYFVPVNTIGEYVLEPGNAWPNPFHNKIQLGILDGERLEQVRICDASGRIVHLLENPDNSIDLSELGEGIYFLQARTDRRSLFVRLLKD